MNTEQYIGEILKILYNKGNYQTLNIHEFLVVSGKMNERDFKIFRKKLVGTNFVVMEEVWYDDIGPEVTNIVGISDIGIEIIRKFGSYEASQLYIQKKQKTAHKKERRQAFFKGLPKVLDSLTKVVAIAGSISTVTLAILTYSNSEELKELRKERDKLRNENDTLRHKATQH